MKMKIIIDEIGRIGKVVGFDGKQIMAKPWYSQDTVPHGPDGVLSTHTSWWPSGEGEVRGLWYHSRLGQFIDGRLFDISKVEQAVYVSYKSKLFAASFRSRSGYHHSCWLVSCRETPDGISYEDGLSGHGRELLSIPPNIDHVENRVRAVALHGLFAAEELELAK